MRAFSSPWRRRRTAIFSSLILTFTVNLMAHWAIRYTANPHTLTSTSTPTLITILSISRLYSPHWYKGYVPFVARRACTVNWSFSRPFSGRTVAATDRSEGPEKPDSVVFLSYVGTTFSRMSRLLSRHNLKSVGLLPKNIPGFLRPVKDDLGLNTPGVATYPAIVVRSTAGRLAVPSRPLSRSTSATSVYSIRINPPWPNTASTWTTASNSRTSASYPANLDTWT
jgi:hypothetical protein